MEQPTSVPTRVLVVDDQHNIADSLATILRYAGFDVAAAYSGEEAVTTARTFRPDIVIADYSMPPGMNGIEAGVKIKRLLPGSRIILLSAQLLGEEIAPFQTKGYNFLLLSKPMHPEDLLKTLNDEDEVVVHSTRQPRVLHVDDVEEHRYSISRLLARAGFEVSEASTGVEALRRALESQPELVLLDIHLPDMDGYDVCVTLKSNPETSRIAVIHVTASDRSPESAMRSAKAGADEYLTYPVIPSRLIHRIRELLQQRYLGLTDLPLR